VYYARKIDEEDHIKLSKKVYGVLGRDCELILKHWRDVRNETEYYPYTKFNLEESAKDSLVVCDKFLNACFEYLHNRGVKDVY
ncbi:MAG: hypothetical protein ACE5KT_12180, partial [Methanosarcinales archaeon]